LPAITGKLGLFLQHGFYATGKPYTEPIGGYQITLPDGTVEDFISVGPKNGARYPDYHRLDIALSRNFKLGDMGIEN